MSITWMYSPKGGHLPCGDPAMVEECKKAGWTECGPPPWKNKPAETGVELEKMLSEDDAKTDDALDELATLKEEAEKLGVKLDRRWGVKKIKQALGLK